VFGREEDFQLKSCCCDSHGCDGEDYDGDDDDDSLSEGVKNWSFSSREEEITNVVVVSGKVDQRGRKITLTLSRRQMTPFHIRSKSRVSKVHLTHS